MLAQNVGANAVIMAAPLNEVNSLAAFDMKGVNIPVFMIDQSNAELLGQALSDNFVLLSPTLILLQQDTNKSLEKDSTPVEGRNSKRRYKRVTSSQFIGTQCYRSNKSGEGSQRRSLYHQIRLYLDCSIRGDQSDV